MRPLRWSLRILAVNRSGSASAMARLKRSAKDLIAGHSALWSSGATTWMPLPPGQHREGHQPHVGEQVAQPHRRRLDRAEVEPDVGIEVEHQPVGLFERLRSAAPAVEFDRPHLHAGAGPRRRRRIDNPRPPPSLSAIGTWRTGSPIPAAVVLLEEAILARPCGQRSRVSRRSATLGSSGGDGCKSRQFGLGDASSPGKITRSGLVMRGPRPLQGRVQIFSLPVLASEGAFACSQATSLAGLSSRKPQIRTDGAEYRPGVNSV